MSVVTISKKELKAVVKESVKEIFEQEAMKLRAFFVPLVSSKEQKAVLFRPNQAFFPTPYGRFSKKRWYCA